MKPIVQSIEEEIKTQSGLLLSSEDTNQLRYKKGTVVIQGTDVSVIKANDTIYYDKRAGFTMLINNEPYTIIQEKDVVVVV
jgi:co-chaperonin GroES (HSP10)